jgi:nucleoside-diphosphate-sugar epimerase
MVCLRLSRTGVHMSATLTRCCLVVIGAASGFHAASARALVLGLGDRKGSKRNKREVHYIHTSGTSNLADHPITAPGPEVRIFSDKESVYAHEKSLEATEPYAQGTTDTVVVETGLKVSVPTTIIMSPTIYGLGSGFFNRLSIQVPTLIGAAIAQGHAAVIGTGAGRWDAVHISDLVLLHEIVLAKILSDDPAVPRGEWGILFSQAFEFTWRELAEDVAQARAKLGALRSAQVQEILLEQGSRLWSDGDLQLAELGFASKSAFSFPPPPKKGGGGALTYRFSTPKVMVLIA